MIKSIPCKLYMHLHFILIIYILGWNYLIREYKTLQLWYMDIFLRDGLNLSLVCPATCILCSFGSVCYLWYVYYYTYLACWLAVIILFYLFHLFHFYLFIHVHLNVDSCFGFSRHVTVKCTDFNYLRNLCITSEFSVSLKP